MDSFTWINPVSGSWNDGNTWDFGVPTAFDTAVLAGAGYTVTSTQSNSIGNLSVAAPVILAIANNTNFTWERDPIPNAGTLRLDSTGNDTHQHIRTPARAPRH